VSFVLILSKLMLLLLLLLKNWLKWRRHSYKLLQGH